MDIVEKELESRRKEIYKELELLFKANMKISDWDIPEADDAEVARRLLAIMQEGLDRIASDIEAGKYDNY
jgi:hypothetical protein